MFVNMMPLFMHQGHQFFYDNLKISVSLKTKYKKKINQQTKVWLHVLPKPMGKSCETMENIKAACVHLWWIIGNTLHVQTNRHDYLYAKPQIVFFLPVIVHYVYCNGIGTNLCSHVMLLSIMKYIFAMMTHLGISSHFRLIYISSICVIMRSVVLLLVGY